MKKELSRCHIAYWENYSLIHQLNVNSESCLYHPYDIVPLRERRYLDGLSAILDDPVKAGRFCLDGTKYAESAHFAINSILKLSHKLPNIISDHYVNIRRCFPHKWHRRTSARKARRRVVDSDGYCDWLQISHPEEPMRLVDISSRKICQMERRERATGVKFLNALLSLPYLLDNAGPSEELINLARMARFLTTERCRREYDYEDLIMHARAAIKKYLARMNEVL